MKTKSIHYDNNINVYVMSDIHGNYDKFHKMLDKINFSENDKLIILGDIIDRGPDGIKLILEISGMDNVKYLGGNHEKMMIESLYMMMANNDPNILEEEIMLYLDNWCNRNGGDVTWNEYKLLSYEDTNIVNNAILQSLHDLSLHVVIGNNSYFLTHAFPSNDKNKTYCDPWKRPTVHEINNIDNILKQVMGPNYIDGTKAITGHTPVLYYHDAKNYEDGYHLGMYQKGNFFDIDCGCPYTDLETSRLLCLRLNDMKEFYV